MLHLCIISITTEHKAHWALGREIGEEGEEGRNIVWKTWRGIKDVDPKGE